MHASELTRMFCSERTKDSRKRPKSITRWLPVEGFPDVLLFFCRLFAHSS